MDKPLQSTFNKMLVKFASQYSRNEENNAHSDNVVLLAETFGDSDDIIKARKILESHEKIGYITEELYNERQNLHTKLYTRFRNILTAR